MTEELKTIKLGFVNCYLLKSEQGFVLIDTGMGPQRGQLTSALESAGVRPGNLQLILITHADPDHIGNADYLRERYGAKIAMHPLEAATAATGDPTQNRKPTPDKVSPLFRLAMSLGKLLSGQRQPVRLESDFTVDEGSDLSAYGLNASIIRIPGHSRGSIGVLTGEGDLICGDLLTNYRRPGTAIIDDIAGYHASIARLQQLNLHMIYPGHGKPISPAALSRLG